MRHMWYGTVQVCGPTGSIIETMEQYIQKVDARVAVLASRTLTAAGSLHDASVVASVTMAAIKHITRPLLVVTANSRHITSIPISVERESIPAVHAVTCQVPVLCHTVGLAAWLQSGTGLSGQWK